MVFEGIVSIGVNEDPKRKGQYGGGKTKWKDRLKASGGYLRARSSVYRKPRKESSSLMGGKGVHFEHSRWVGAY